VDIKSAHRIFFPNSKVVPWIHPNESNFILYRKIYDDLSDGSIKVEDENGQVMARVATIPAGAINDQTSTQTVTIPQGIQITTQGGAFSAASLQTVPISGQSATIVQYPAGQNGQEGQFIYAAAPGDVEVGQIINLNFQ
jgi:hypothetical protein